MAVARPRVWVSQPLFDDIVDQLAAHCDVDAVATVTEHAPADVAAALRDADGALLGTAIWWDWDGRLATLGLVVVRPDCQGRGIGRMLMNAILAETGERTVGLVATQAGLKLYQDCGFVVSGSIVQCQGTVASGPASPSPRGVQLRDAGLADRAALFALDAAAVGARRPELLDAVLETGLPSLLAERQGRLVGAALLRPAGRGVTIGPLLAESEDLAIALADAALDRIDGLARLDLPASATRLVAHLETRGLPVVDRVTAMLRGPVPAISGPARRFGLVSQAFG